MNNEDIIKLVEQPFNPSLFEKYKQGYNILFAPLKASNCGCNAQSLYNNLRQKLNELKTKNPTQTKNPQSGKFEPVKPIEIKPVVSTQPEIINEESNVDFILTVKKELFEGYLDIEKITKAYRIIMNDNDAHTNLRAMKLAIINYESN